MSTAGRKHDDHEMRLYLLGKLPPERREELQAQFFEDDASYDRLLEAENDLIDDYARGKLTADDARAVEEGLAVGQQQQDSIRFARALWRAEQRRAGDVHTKAHGHVQQWAIAAAIAVVSITSAAWFAVQNASLRHDLVTATRNAQTVAEVRNTPLPNAPPFAAVTLDPTLRGTGARVVTVPASAGLVKIELAGIGGFNDYSPELQRGGSVVWTESGVTASTEGVLTVWIPSELLSEGSYEFIVYGSANGARRLAGAYPFQVRRPASTANSNHFQ